MKRKLLLLLFIIAFVVVKAQVNLQTGSAEFSLPVYSYKDNYCGISLNVSISYSSKNGILVDEVPSSIGQGWDINGLGLITRMQNGLPDDQFGIDGNWNDVGKYPSGILNTTKPISSGCPTLLNNYPVFENTNQLYKDNNVTAADREHDIFVYEFNGRSGRFMIDKNWNVVMLSDNRLKGTVYKNYIFTPDCRTTIDQFSIKDENGVVYEFAEKELSKTFNYYPDDPFSNSIFSTNIPHTIANNYRPYVAKSWYITKIVEPITNRTINFTYAIVNTEMDGPINIEYKYKTGSYAPANTNNGPHITGLEYPRRSTDITKLKNSFKKPEITKISFPDNSHIDFNYSQERLDCPGAFKLDNISSINANQERVSKILLEQKYFVKNTISDASSAKSKWSRLCLKSVTTYGKTDNDKTNPYLFDYYVGTNTIEDFVPPIFFHAKDPWGYYNGSYCGIAVDELMDEAKLHQTINTPPYYTNAQKLALYNSPEINGWYPGAANFDEDCLTYIRANAKTNYARNGLLKSISNPYGGITNYFYEQNKSDAGCFYAPYYNIDDKIVGGVHVSKVESISEANTLPTVTEYKYANTDGTSSMWGMEYPTNIKRFGEFYEPYSQYVSFPGCNYRYKHTGKMYTQIASSSTNSGIQKVLSAAYRFMQTYAISYARGLTRSAAQKSIDPYIALAEFIINYILSCGATYDNGIAYVHQNSILNYANSLPAQFKRVEVNSYSGTLNNGKAIYEFTSSDDFPVLVSKNYFPYISKQRAYNWIYGLPKKTTFYNNNGQVIKSVENIYNLIENKFTGDNTLSCNCTPTYFKSKRSDEWNTSAEINNFAPTTLYTSQITGYNGPKLSVEFYNQAAGRAELVSSTEKVYKSPTNFLSSTTTFSYNTKNYLLAASKIIDDKGKEVETKTYYIEDYDLNNSANAILKLMKDNNYVNTPVSNEVWQKKENQQPELLSATATEFGKNYGAGQFVPLKLYSLQTDKPVPLNIIGGFDNTKLVRNTGFIKPVLENKFNQSYYLSGPSVVLDITGDKKKSFLYSNYPKGLPIAIISNANAEECAYIPSANFISNAMFFSKPALGKESKITFWANTGNKIKVAIGLWNGNAWAFNDISPAITENPGNRNMIYYEFKIPAGYQLQVRNENNCQLDEFRFYPINAFMETVGYDVQDRKIKECDINNRITYYEYDGLGRPTKVLDENSNIIKTYEYHFKN